MLTHPRLVWCVGPWTVHPHRGGLPSTRHFARPLAPGKTLFHRATTDGVCIHSSNRSNHLQGDDQIIACTYSDIFHFDFRVSPNRHVQRSSEWILPVIGTYGDESILADRAQSIYTQLSERSTMAFTQFSSSSSPSPAVSSSASFSSGPSTVTAGHITCSNTSEYYTVVGSNLGCLWILDRR